MPECGLMWLFRSVSKGDLAVEDVVNPAWMTCWTYGVLEHFWIFFLFGNRNRICGKISSEERKFFLKAQKCVLLFSLEMQSTQEMKMENLSTMRQTYVPLGR